MERLYSSSGPSFQVSSLSHPSYSAVAGDLDGFHIGVENFLNIVTTWTKPPSKDLRVLSQ
jgi:hypothetical protein